MSWLWAATQVWSIDSEDTAEVVQRIAGWVKDHDPLVPDQFYEEVRLIQIANGFDARIRMYCKLLLKLGIGPSSCF